MDRLRVPLLVLASVVLSAGPSLGQAGLFRATVTDPGGDPVPNVRVTITSPDQDSFRKSLTTNKRGEFRHRFTRVQLANTFELLFEKPGYESFVQPVTLSAMDDVQDSYVMNESESEVVGERGDLAAVVSGGSSTAVEAFNAGLTAQRAGDGAAALAGYEAALAADPDLVPAHTARSQVLLDLERYDEALGSAERALALQPSSVDALRVRYQALRALGRADEAEAVSAALDAAEGAASAALRAYNEGGEAFGAGDRALALAKFQESASLDPTLIDAHHSVATLELANGNHEASAVAAEKALALGSGDVRTLRVLYDAYDHLGRTGELAEIAPRLATVDPDFGGAKLLEQAAEAWNAGDAARAVSLSRASLSVDSTLAKAYYFIGLDHLSKGENAEAKAALSRFVELAPEDVDAATAHEMLGYIE